MRLRNGSARHRQDVREEWDLAQYYDGTATQDAIEVTKYSLAA